MSRMVSPYRYSIESSRHQGTTAIMPDKAKVEVGVQVVQRWILARLRNRQFFSLAEVNHAIR